MKLFIVTLLLVCSNTRPTSFIDAKDNQKKNMDEEGLNITIISKPHFRREQKYDRHLMDDKGRQRDEVFTYLDFNYNGKLYSVKWKSVSSPEPIYLDENRTYKFLLRLDTENKGKCSIVKIWCKDRLIWENRKLTDNRSL